MYLLLTRWLGTTEEKSSDCCAGMELMSNVSLVFYKPFQFCYFAE